MSNPSANPQCGCKLVKLVLTKLSMKDFEIRYCPLHKAAPELLACLKAAQPEFCSMKCPSVGKAGAPIPHLPACQQMRAAIAQAEGKS